MAPVARLIYGSCNTIHSLLCPDLTKECQYVDQPLWDTINDLNPEAFIWLGDAIYGDYIHTLWDMLTTNFRPGSEERMRDLFKRQKLVPGYAALLKKTKVIGTWDDHDFGFNNGGSEMNYMGTAAAYKEFIGGEFPAEGVYTAHRFDLGGLDAHVILLDNRTFRTKSDQTSTPTLLGATQWAWLEQKLGEKADLVVIGSGIQVLPLDRDSSMSENWEGHPQERERILNLLRSLNTKFVPLLISGDVHWGEVLDVGCMVEVTSSGLTHTFKDSSALMGVGTHDSIIEEILANVFTHWFCGIWHSISLLLNAGEFVTDELNFGDIVYQNGAVTVNLRGQHGIHYSKNIPRREDIGDECNFFVALTTWEKIYKLTIVYLHHIRYFLLMFGLLTYLDYRRKRRTANCGVKLN